MTFLKNCCLAAGEQVKLLFEMFFAALSSSAILALVLMASEFIGSVVCWSLPEAWFAVSSGVSLSAMGFSDHEIGLGSSKAKICIN